MPFGLGWRTHFNFCVAVLPDAKVDREPVLKKSKQFTIFEFVKKGESDEVTSDCDTPKACLLTQFHVVFAYLSNITVISRVNQQVVHTVSLKDLHIRDISFDLQMSRILVITKSAPCLMGTLENEKVDAWRQFLARGSIEEAFQSHQTPEQRLYLAGIWADQQFEKGNHDRAAKLYVQSDRSFEEICLKFMNHS